VGERATQPDYEKMDFLSIQLSGKASAAAMIWEAETGTRIRKQAKALILHAAVVHSQFRIALVFGALSDQCERPALVVSCRNGPVRECVYRMLTNAQ
jgi:uncharacterized protein (DUF1786 family)